MGSALYTSFSFGFPRDYTFTSLWFYVIIRHHTEGEKIAGG